MRQCIALAGMVCLLATGCAGSGLLAGKGCAPCHVATSQCAPRPTIFRDGCRPCCGFSLFGKKDKGCDVACGCEVGCGCEDEYCDAGCCGEGCDGEGCCGGDCGSCKSGRGPLCGLGGRCRCAVDGIASGFCPHRGGYPEYANYNAGPPTPTVAYPYYTVRGPRDFLQCNPPSIGPY
ncbi:MAG: hypothetical protein KDA44_21720 [Planctomycetales bacterium]|nr:hypothetical protein [Planctomycetales bacterium]